MSGVPVGGTAEKRWLVRERQGRGGRHIHNINKDSSITGYNPGQKRKYYKGRTNKGQDQDQK